MHDAGMFYGNDIAGKKREKYSTNINSKYLKNIKN